MSKPKLTYEQKLDAFYEILDELPLGAVWAMIEGIDAKYTHGIACRNASAPYDHLGLLLSWCCQHVCSQCCGDGCPDCNDGLIPVERFDG